MTVAQDSQNLQRSGRVFLMDCYLLDGMISPYGSDFLQPAGHDSCAINELTDIDVLAVSG